MVYAVSFICIVGLFGSFSVFSKAVVKYSKPSWWAKALSAAWPIVFMYGLFLLATGSGEE